MSDIKIDYRGFLSLKALKQAKQDAEAKLETLGLEPDEVLIPNPYANAIKYVAITSSLIAGLVFSMEKIEDGLKFGLVGSGGTVLVSEMMKKRREREVGIVYGVANEEMARQFNTEKFASILELRVENSYDKVEKLDAEVIRNVFNYPNHSLQFIKQERNHLNFDLLFIIGEGFTPARHPNHYVSCDDVKFGVEEYRDLNKSIPDHKMAMENMLQRLYPDYKIQINLRKLDGHKSMIAIFNIDLNLETTPQSQQSPFSKLFS